ncbi:MAG: RNA polymerase factor sigma-54 [Chloroherpetonaceae bacterium]
MAINVSVNIGTQLQQTLTPQQIQYLKLLQMPLIEFEEEVKRQIEENPLLEMADDATANRENEINETSEEPLYDEEFEESPIYDNEQEFDISEESASEDEVTYFNDLKLQNEIPLSNYNPEEDEEPSEFYKMVLQDDAEYIPNPRSSWDDDENEPFEFQIKENLNFIEELEKQLNLFPFSEEELLIGKHILWNVDDDGYLRRDLSEIVTETNSNIAELNFEIQKNKYLKSSEDKLKSSKQNPACNYQIEDKSKKMLGEILIQNPDLISTNSSDYVVDIFREKEDVLKSVTLEQVEKVLKIIQQLDPPGIASRNLQECLIAQCKAILKPTPSQKIALRVLTEAFDEFSKKHFKDVMKKLDITEEELKDAFESIKKLNPKPGEGFSYPGMSTIIPDFIIENNEETGEPQIILNDTTIPPFKISTIYEMLKKEAKEKKYNKETKHWIRSKYEDAKFLIQAVQQRRATMLKVMGAIAGIQKEFFIKGPKALKPLIYADISNLTGLDISTVCRIVNNKFVQTNYGTYELKYFFSEALPNDEGEEVSTTIIKARIKEMIEQESKKRPMSDEAIADKLKQEGFNVARRTVAKYREQMKIPVARLRKEL